MVKPSFPKANPPFHAVALVGTILVLCLSTFPRVLSTIDSVATIESCTTPLFPQILSRAALGWIRLLFAAFVFVVTVYVMNQENIMKINYLKGSKLRSIPVDFSGIKSQAFFTSWCWNILGLSFLLSGLTTLYIDQQIMSTNSTEEEIMHMISSKSHMKYILRATVLSFEVAAPLSMLVSAVVRYALWPKALAGNGTDELKQTHILIQHNANVIMSLIEVGLLGGLECRFMDIAVAPIFGIVFVLFSWSMKNQWLETGEAQLPYFFLDTTMGKFTSIALLVLLFALTLFYAIFVLVDDLILMLGGGIFTHAAVVVGISSLVCRFKD